ncbi:MAG: TrpB-like pyridoxal phosphate-dependent enzyme [Thaumarchaeota archaeon]|nr:TrpB-like pyridoxal phosphate-dependent enzyme [Nitrososphaerota archaeon]
MVTRLERTVEIPRQWYNIAPDLPSKIPPVIDQNTHQIADKKILHRLFVGEVARHEYSNERFITIPEELRDVYSIWRPTPLVRAKRLEKALGTPARIYYKNESVSPPGSHKANAAVAQAYYAAKEGTDRLITSTTAGQWGTALAFGCTIFDVKCTIYMARSNFESKPYRKDLAEAWGAEIIASPSNRTSVGRKILADDPNSPGTMSIAKSEALEDTEHDPTAKDAVGSIMNFVLATQTVIGQEAQAQMEFFDDYPDMVIGCVGGGSNFSGIFWPYYYRMVSKTSPKQVDFLAVESSAVPKLTKGQYIYDHSDVMRMSPLFKMYTAGHTFVPPEIHTGGLRVHGTAPSLSLLVNTGAVRAVAYNQPEIFEAGAYFARHEGILPAPESAHAIKAVIDEAKLCKEQNKEKVILFSLCGHGILDIEGYREYFSGHMKENDADPAELKRSLDSVKSLYPWLQSSD